MKSRYQAIKQVYTIDARRGSVLMTSFRTNSNTTKVGTVKIHTLMSGQELLDYVAKVYFNDEYSWWAIAEQNTTMHLFPLDFQAGEKIKIPSRVI